MTARSIETGAPSLLELVQGLLERTYRMRTGVEDLARFVIGDSGYRVLYGDPQAGAFAAAADGSGARTLVRETSQGVRACVYYPDGLIRTLERYPPQRGLGDENVDSFADLVEELDHLLVVAERSREGRETTLFELELHANVSKHLVLSRFLAGRHRRLAESRRRWLRHHLFEKIRYCDSDPAVRARYRDAARFAVRMIDRIGRLRPAERLRALRRFHRAPSQEKVRLIRSLG